MEPGVTHQDRKRWARMADQAVRAGGGLGVNVRQAARLCSRDSSTLWSLLLHKKAYL